MQKRKRTLTFSKSKPRTSKASILNDFRRRAPDPDGEGSKKKVRTKYLIKKLQPEREELVVKNHLLARKIAHDCMTKYNLAASGEQYDDIQSEAFIGLIKAAMRFDFNRKTNAGTNVKFSSFAVVYIRGEVLHYLRDKTHQLKISHSLKEVWQRGKKMHWADVSMAEIASELDIPLSTWTSAVLACSGPPLPLMDHAQLVPPPEIFESSIEPYVSTGKVRFERLSVREKLTMLRDFGEESVVKLSNATVKCLTS